MYDHISLKNIKHIKVSSMDITFLKHNGLLQIRSDDLALKSCKYTSKINIYVLKKQYYIYNITLLQINT